MAATSPSLPPPSVGPAPWQLRTLSLLLPGALTLLVLGRSLLTLHVLCNSVAFLLLFPEGTLLATHNIWLRRPVRGFTAHVVVQMAALMLGLLGTGAMLLHQHAKRAPHFASAHAWLGVGTVLCAEFGGLLGALAFSGILQLLPEQLMPLRVLHRILGRLALLLSSATILFGLHVFDVNHPRHQGWRTYTVALGLGVHAVGMQSVLLHTMPISWHLLTGSKVQGEPSSRARPDVGPLRAMPSVF